MLNSALSAAFAMAKRRLRPARVQSSFGVTVDRESLVSSLSKKVARKDRFLRTGKNTFSLRPEAK